MPRINEDLQLVGLIINMLPFEYTDNMLTANISKYLDISELELQKKDLEAEKEQLESPDQELNDAIYFIDQMIINLQAALDGNNL
jgi:hypothetical protein